MFGLGLLGCRTESLFDGVVSACSHTSYVLGYTSGRRSLPRLSSRPFPLTDELSVLPGVLVEVPAVAGGIAMSSTAMI